MKFCSLCSGSSGNSIYVETSSSKFIVDAGFSGKQIENQLEMIGVRGSELDFILVTHEHIDHSRGVGVLSRRFNLPILTNYQTFLAMDKTIGKVKEENVFLFETNSPFSFRDLEIVPVATYHDAADPVSFVIEGAGKKLTILTDTGLASQEMVNYMKESDGYFIESNHCPVMLENGPYPYALKERIRSTHGHLSNLDTRDLLSQLLRGEGEKVLLGHISDENNLPQLAFETSWNHFMDLGMGESDLRLEISPRFDVSRLMELR